MKLQLITSIILSIISISALAIEGHGFKIISEKITKSPGFKGGFQEVSGAESAWHEAHAILRIRR